VEIAFHLVTNNRMICSFELFIYTEHFRSRVSVTGLQQSRRTKHSSRNLVAAVKPNREVAWLDRCDMNLIARSKLQRQRTGVQRSDGTSCNKPTAGFNSCRQIIVLVSDVKKWGDTVDSNRAFEKAETFVGCTRRKTALYVVADAINCQPIDKTRQNGWRLSYRQRWECDRGTL